MRLVQTLQFAWFVGHVSLLLCTVRYGLSYIAFNYYSKWARFSYRTAFLSAVVTYGIVVYKGYRARTRQGKSTGAIALLADENVQYLIISVVWLFSRQVPLAILPFTVYSVFHVLTYTRANLLPAISPPAATPASPSNKSKPVGGLSESIGKFVKEYYDGSMGLVALLEIALWFRVLFSAILFQKGSWILIVAYSAFFRARYAQSTFVQKAVANLSARADASLANQSTPPVVRNGWGSVKGVVKQIHDATDLTKYVGGQQPAGVKKAQ